MPTMHGIADWWGAIKNPYIRANLILLSWLALMLVTGLFYGSLVAVLLFDFYSWARRDD